VCGHHAASLLENREDRVAGGRKSLGSDLRDPGHQHVRLELLRDAPEQLLLDYHLAPASDRTVGALNDRGSRFARHAPGTLDELVDLARQTSHGVPTRPVALGDDTDGTAILRDLARLYQTLRGEYGSGGGLVGYDLGRKTEMLLVREAKAAPYGTPTRTVEYDAETLERLRKNAKTDTGKVMNLLRDLRTRAEADAATTPALRGLFERAQRVTEAFQERQLSTQQAFDEIQKLVDERKKAEAERTKLGMDAPTFGVYWLLEEAKLPGAKALAVEINALFERFPSYGRSADEMRQLKAEIYKALLKEVSGKRMVELGDNIIKSRTV
jgi:hypothetical protein